MMIRVTVWNENIHDRTDDEVKSLYPNGMHNFIAEFLQKDEVRCRANRDDGDAGARVEPRGDRAHGRSDLVGA